MVYGSQGSGKSIFGVKEAYDNYKKGMKIISNIHLNFPYKPIDLNKILNCEYQDAFMLWDEVHQYLSNRRSMSLQSIEITDSFLSMIRKRNLKLFCTTQTVRKPDIKLKEESDVFFYCRRKAFINGKWEFCKHNLEYDRKVPISVSITAEDQNTGERVETEFLANPYFNLYDSRQIIKVKNWNEYTKKKTKKVSE